VYAVAVAVVAMTEKGEKEDDRFISEVVAD
jgi:hypothetical protein